MRIKIMLFCIITINSSFFSYCQINRQIENEEFRIIKNIFEDLSKLGNVDSSVYKQGSRDEVKFLTVKKNALEKIVKLKDEYPNNPFIKYFKYRIYDIDNEIEKAFLELYPLNQRKNNKYDPTKSSNYFGFYFLLDQSMRDKLKSNFNFDHPKIEDEFNESEFKLFNYYCNIKAVENPEYFFTYFINTFQNSIYSDSAYRKRFIFRYKKAKKENSIEVFTNFINTNKILTGDQEMINLIDSAKLNRAILAFDFTLNLNTIEAYENYIREYSKDAFNTSIIDIANLKIKFLKLNNINDLYTKILNENYQYINNFITNTVLNKYDIVYDNWNDNLLSVTIKSDGKEFQPINLFRDVESCINEFNTKYDKSIEILFLDKIKNNINNIKEDIAFKIIEFDNTNEFLYDKFIKQFPNSKYSTYIKNQLVSLHSFNSRKEEIAKNIQEIKRIEAEEKEQIETLARLKKEKKEAELNDPMYQIMRRFSESDKKLLQLVIDGKIDTDPKGLVGEKCGTGYTRCKWCGKSVSYEKQYSSVVQELKMSWTLSRAMVNMSQIAQIGAVIESSVNSILTGEKVYRPQSREQSANMIADEMKVMIQNIRGGSYYACSNDNSDMFCSEKCRYEYKNR